MSETMCKATFCFDEYTLLWLLSTVVFNIVICYMVCLLCCNVMDHLYSRAFLAFYNLSLICFFSHSGSLLLFASHLSLIQQNNTN